MEHPFNVELESERLILRQMNLSDVEDMFEYTSNAEVTTYLSWDAHTDIKQTLNHISSVVDNYESVKTEFPYAIILKESNKMIGSLKVTNISYYNKRAEFTSILNPVFQRKGYMVEAWNILLDFCFNTIGLNRIQSYVTEDNIGSQKKNDKVGLIYEGRLRKYWIMKGEVKDALVYSITKEDYTKIVK